MVEPTSWEERSLVMAPESIGYVPVLQQGSHWGLRPLRNGGVGGMTSLLHDPFSSLQGAQI